MGVAVNIISAVLKSVVGDKIGNELTNEVIEIAIDGVSEKGIDRISDFINGEKAKIENIISKENMKSIGISEESIDYVVAEIKDLLLKIAITDEVLRQCKYDSMNLSIFLWTEYCKRKNVHIECESDIKKGLLAVSKALVKLMRESEEFEKEVLIHISNSVDDANVGLKKISEYMKENFGKLDAGNQTILEILRMVFEQSQGDSAKNKEKKQPTKSRTQEYADKWNQNMFLNDFDKRDQKAGINIKLSEVYLEEHLPHYIWRDNEEPLTDLKELLSEYIIEKRNNTMLLIFGQPGVGKSTLITWITVNFADKINDILVYKFASDLRNTDWQNGRISNKVLEKLSLNHSDLNGKTLIIDGFDEGSIEPNRRRENYVSQFAILKCKYITLQPWDEIQIKSFCNIFQEKTKNIVFMETIERLLENKEILGIPLILYMVLALNIDIEKEGSIVDVYDKIFSLEGGVYDRCIDNKMFEDKHRIGDVKEQIHQISKDIAIWMFENNSNKASIPQIEYEKICNNVKIKYDGDGQAIKQDAKIGNYFKIIKHCEGVETEELYFVHRTIYEYFVAETIYSSIENAMLELSEKSQEEFAGIVTVFLKQGCVNYTIAEYLQYKILKLYARISEEKQKRFYQWWESAVDKMMECGMFYYSGKNVSYFKNIISAECRCFLNLIEILRLLMDIDNKEYIMENAQSELVEKYIKCCCVEYKRFSSDKIMDLSKMFLQKVNLKGIQLKGICLNQVNLERADLVNVDLSRIALLKADLAYADLRGTNLRDAALMEVDLRGTDLTRANLNGAKLVGADLRGVDLTGAYMKGIFLDGALIDDYQVPDFEKKLNLHGVKIFINKTQKIVSYDEYCESK